MLLQHTDVVPADADFWSVDPLGGVEKEGYIYGRGAVDMKGGGIIQLAAFIALKRSGVPLNRDVIFMATADEEAGGLFGAGWLVKNRPELFRGVGIVLNEGGTGTIIGGRHVFNVEVTQKVPVWLRLKASGQPGHGSRPLPTSATTKIVRAMTRILDNPFEPRAGGFRGHGQGGERS